MVKDISLEVYESDASGIKGKATKIVYAQKTDDIQQVVKSGEKITIRGAGSGLVGGAVPENDLVLDLSKMDRILNFDLKNKIIEVEAGVILDELNEFLDKYGLEFPVKPGSHSICTIGGMIATNAAGERAVKYGKTIKWVENIEVVDGLGNLVKVKKFELADFIGLEGITGIIVRAKLKLVEKKKRTATLIAADTIKEVIENIERYNMLKEVSEVEFLDKLTSSLIGLGEKYHLIFEFESDSGDLKGQAYDNLMSRRDGVYPVLAKNGFVKIEDPRVQLNRLEEFFALLEELKVPYYGHIGLGIIHPVFRRDEDNKIRQVLDFVRRIKGEVSGEHGIGLRKKEFLDDTAKKIILRVKKRYDPSNKLNSGKVINLDRKLNAAEERRKEELDKIQAAIEQQNMMNSDSETKEGI